MVTRLELSSKFIHPRCPLPGRTVQIARQRYLVHFFAGNVFQQLGGNLLLHREHDTVLGQDSYADARVRNGFHRILNLIQAAFGRKCRRA